MPVWLWTDQSHWIGIKPADFEPRLEQKVFCLLMRFDSLFWTICCFMYLIQLVIMQRWSDRRHLVSSDRNQWQLWRHSTKTVQFRPKSCYFSLICLLLVEQVAASESCLFQWCYCCFLGHNKSSTNTFIALRPWDVFIGQHNKEEKHSWGSKCY